MLRQAEAWTEGTEGGHMLPEEVKEPLRGRKTGGAREALSGYHLPGASPVNPSQAQG